MLYEGGIRVPLTIKWSGKIKPGTVSNAPVIGTDLYPTILKLTGIDAPKDIELDGEDIGEIIKAVLPLIKDTVLFMKGKYDLQRCIETLEDYIRASGMKSDHRTEGELHHFIIQHELGMNWSLFTEQLLKEIFHQFVPDKNLKFQTTKSTIIATIPLGSDFSEHDY